MANGLIETHTNKPGKRVVIGAAVVAAAIAVGVAICNFMGKTASGANEPGGWTIESPGCPESDNLEGAPGTPEGSEVRLESNGDADDGTTSTPTGDAPSIEEALLRYLATNGLSGHGYTISGPTTNESGTAVAEATVEGSNAVVALQQQSDGAWFAFRKSGGQTSVPSIEDYTTIAMDDVEQLARYVGEEAAERMLGAYSEWQRGRGVADPPTAAIIQESIVHGAADGECDMSAVAGGDQISISVGQGGAISFAEQ